jgi:L-aminoadipate-semialdehyde dehydrogenase
MGKYLAYLVGIGFLSLPTEKGSKALTAAVIGKEQKEALLSVGGRGALH